MTIVINYVRVEWTIKYLRKGVKSALDSCYGSVSQFVDTQSFDIFECEDPEDDKFLECAVAGKCNTIISGDKHLLNLQDMKVLLF